MGPHAQSTLPPAASAPPEAEPDWPTLGLSRRDFLDPGALFAEIATADDPRPTARKILRAALKDGRAKLAERVAAAPLASGEAAAAYTHLADGMVTTAFDIARRLLHPAHAPTRGERLAVVLVGGSGRGEMAPFSDIDLLFLTPWKTTPWAESVIESTLYILWDLKLKLGHSVRTVDECLRQARGDMTIRTALLEHRHLAGAAPLTEELSSRLWTEVIARTGPDFVEAKLEERDQRHRRTGGTRFLVEPNVKESKGGLRDLQTLYWIAKYVERARSVEDLVERGVFDAAEMKIFQEAEAFLWAVRIQLHLLAGRAVEVLSFDMQVEVAAALGFDDAPGLRGVERFMQAYFSHARHVGALTRIFLTDLEAQHVKKRPSIRRTLQRLGLGTERVGDAYRVVNGRLDLVDADILTSDPINMLRYLEEGIRTGILLHPNGMRQIALNIDLIDDRVRADPEANEIFVRLVHESADPVRALRRMHELGLLSAFLPPFGRITAMMQYNMYHRYTVDEHTIQCIHELNKIVAGRRREVLPLASQIVEKGVNLRVLSIALLFHDIGKGRAEDHSIVGADIAEELCPRLGLLPEECEAVVWLVRNHLVMSDTAQKRDLADARTIADFASLVGSPTRLRLLLVLTVCDIRGVGPGVWNNWKAQLFRHLYRQTLEVLTGTVDPRSMRQRVGEAKTAFRQALPDWSTEALDTECARHYDAFWLGLDLDTQLSLIEIQGASTSDEPAIRLDLDAGRDATRAVFAMPDHPGLFARIAGALALSGANVVDARSYTTSDGMATDVFWIQDDAGQPYEKARLFRLRATIAKALAGEVIVRDAVAGKDRLPRREREFQVPTEILFDNTGSEIFTVIEVSTRDRPGLLYDLARTLTRSGISISSAIIATYGEEAVDSFYVKDIFGLKILSPQKQAQIRARLAEAIARGAARAEG